MTQASLFESGDGPSVAALDWFETFWQLYPAARRVNKAKARAAFIRANITARDMALIVEVLPQQARSPQWNEHPRYIPHPTTYLNQRRWTDDPAAFAPAPPTAEELRMANNVRMARGCPHGGTCEDWRACVQLIVDRIRARRTGEPAWR